jgi:hypothetical protein
VSGLKRAKTTGVKIPNRTQLLAKVAGAGRVRVHNVKGYGALGDGMHDDTAHILAAITAAGAAPVFVPTGTYLITSLSVPSGTTLVGESKTAAWLKGHIHYASSSAFSKLKIGTADDAAAYHANGANGVTFTDCRFRGGGYNGTNWRAVLPLAGTQGAISNLTFTRCDVECNLGIETAGPPYRGLNNISMNEVMDDDGHIDGLHFIDCDFGVSNGVRTGSPCFNVELTTRNWNGGANVHWAHDLTFHGCTFQMGDETSLDIESAEDDHYSEGNFSITDCLFLGAGKVDATYAQCLCLEIGQHAVVTGNTFYGGKYASLECYGSGESAHCVITGNTFDDTKGHTSHTHVVAFSTSDNIFTGNTIIAAVDASFIADTGTGNTTSPNTINGVVV